jgi:hypothetical protein
LTRTIYIFPVIEPGVDARHKAGHDGTVEAARTIGTWISGASVVGADDACAAGDGPEGWPILVFHAQAVSDKHHNKR